MKVSVIVPYCEPDGYLVRMRAQLAAQTHPDCETLFVQDAERRGAAWARNRGLERATGEVVLFADVDDELSPDWVARMVAGLGAADLGWAAYTQVEGECRRLLPDGAPTAELQGPAVEDYLAKRVFGYRLRDLPKAMLPGGLWKRCGREMAGVWRLAARRGVLDGLRFDESLRLYEDAMFITAVSRRAKTLRVFGDAGYVWTVRSEGTMSTEFAVRRLANKFAVRDARKALDPGLRRWRGTFVLSILECLRYGGLKSAVRYATGRPYSGYSDPKCDQDGQIGGFSDDAENTPLHTVRSF